MVVFNRSRQAGHSNWDEEIQNPSGIFSFFLSHPSSLSDSLAFFFPVSLCPAPQKVGCSSDLPLTPDFRLKAFSSFTYSTELFCRIAFPAHFLRLSWFGQISKCSFLSQRFYFLAYIFLFPIWATKWVLICPFALVAIAYICKASCEILSATSTKLQNT